MNLNPFFKSIIEQDTAAVVICDMTHTMIYFNKAAIKNYEKYGGAELVGKSIFDCHNPRSGEIIRNVVAWFAKSKENNIVHTEFNEKKNKDVYMVALRDDNGELIGYYEKHEFRTKDESPFYEMN